MFVLIFALLAVVNTVAANAPLQPATLEAPAACPCANSTWCKPVAATYEREVYIFHKSDFGTRWQDYAWPMITTVAIYDGDVDPNLLCYAHSLGVRVVLAAFFEPSQLPSPSARAAWVSQQAAAVANSFTDGLSIDIEGNTAYADELSEMIAEVAKALRASNPHAQVGFTAPIMPDGTTGGYDYTALSTPVDFFIPMAYDMAWAPKIAAANSPLNLVQAGLNQWLATFRIAASKIVLALPWYGYTYPCTNQLATTYDPCDSAAGFNGDWAITFEEVLPYAAANSVWYGTTSYSPYISYKDAQGVWHQIWYDDAHSLSYKYALARTLGLRGVGIWTANFVAYPATAATIEMWNTIAANFTMAAV